MIREGDRLADRYELVSPIANGGMAQVWRATDRVLGRPVAVKILHPHLATDRAFLIRFRREAVAAARLSHPAIVSIYDTVSAPGLEAIVMELVEGRTLRAVLDDAKTLSVADGIDLGIQIADALDEAHRAGIVHRDIKPSNILLCTDRRVMVTDFGIAKAGEDTDLTVTGTLLGTAKYLSPEQVRGDAVDPRSDLYSLGIVLFEVLTGRPPFKADTDAATALARLQHDPPRLRHINPELPQELDDVVFKLTERDPDRRYLRSLDVRAALSGVQIDPTTIDGTLLVAEPVYVPPVSEEQEQLDEDFDSFIRSERTWLLPAVFLVLVAVGLVVAGALFSRSPLAERGLNIPVVGGNDDEASDTTSSDGEEVSSTDTTTLTPFDEVGPPSIVGAQAIDPEGDGRESPDTVALAFDGDPSTYWRSELYRRADFGNLKSGVGLVLDLDGPSVVEEVAIDTMSSGWSVRLFVGDDFSGGSETWAEPAAGGDDLADSQTFDTDGAVGRYLLIWVTNPGLSADGSDEDEEPDNRFQLAEVRVS